MIDILVVLPAETRENGEPCIQGDSWDILVRGYADPEQSGSGDPDCADIHISFITLKEV